MSDDRIAEVTLTATGAWEVWRVKVPANADEAWVRDNFHTAEDKWLHESGCDSEDITAVQFDSNPDPTVTPPF